MAKDYQKVVALGRTTSNMKFKFLPNGTAVANFDLAVNRQGENAKTDYIPCVVWGEVAKNFNDHVGKGSLILVEGQLRSSLIEVSDGKKEKIIRLEVSESKWLDLKSPSPEQVDEQMQA